MKPTVSVKRKGKSRITTLRTVVSRVAKSLFSANASGQVLLKEENAAIAKKEIHNSIQNNEFGKKNDRKEKEVEEIIIEDDTDDWSGVPAFLRRNKK